MDLPRTHPMRVVVAGVAGAGKSTVGAALATQLDARFIDGDSLHSSANVEKMRAGKPLNDTDRGPWLDAIVEVATTEERVVVACSALGRRHRDHLRAIPSLHIAFLEIDQELAEQRAIARTNHFMAADMVTSQFAALERPTRSETDVTGIDASIGLDVLVRALVLELTEPENST